VVCLISYVPVFVCSQRDGQAELTWVAAWLHIKVILRNAATMTMVTTYYAAINYSKNKMEINLQIVTYESNPTI